MKLLRFEKDGVAHIGATSGNGVIDLTAAGCAFRTMLELIQAGQDGLSELKALIAQDQPVLPLADLKLLPPIERPGKYLAIGMNYGKHLEEADRLGVPRSQHQIWFNKQTSCITGPDDDIDPGVTEKLDYEVELGVVIGTPCKDATESSARDHIFGYLVANDVSARDWQFHSPTITLGKSFDTFGPIGPWIVTADEVTDPHDLRLRCYVNGELRQDSSTSQMIANIWAQIAYLSTAFTLQPGDLLATGTPEGVGVGREPPLFLQPGDVVRCEIDKIGVIENRVRRPLN
jgi:2-keto-4-pentenoate hydratase/2-oxohepta-3-ene-1,7-dioic acid hydratase in catechol pathway